MNTDKKYFAFISYKREDEEWAKWIQHKLEHYKLPTNLNGRTDLPKEIRPVFRDTSELNPGNLQQQLHDALVDSQYIIVVCSPHSAHSKWVNKEVETFIELGRTDKIIPFIVDGTAFSKVPARECFPKAIRELPAEQEILGANINEMGRDAAVVKVIAQMFGLTFDELWQRFEREQKKKRNWIITASVMAVLIMTGIASWMYMQRQQTLKANWMMMENRSRFIAEKALSLFDEGDSYTSRRILLDVLPADLLHADKPYTPEAERALRYALQNNSAILKGHKDDVNTVFYNADGTKIISASKDESIRIWDAETGREMQRLIGHNGSVYTASFNNDETQIVSAAGDGTIIVWDAATGEIINSMICDKVNAAYFSPDGKRVVAAVWDNTVKVFDAITAQKLLNLKGHTNFVMVATYSPDGQHIMSASDDFTIRIWDADTGIEQIKMDGHTGWVTTAFYSPDGKNIVSASYDGSVRIWDADTGEQIKILSGHKGEVHSAY